MKLALSMLCENPHRKTGLTTLFHEFVSRGLKLYPNVSWLLFAGGDQEWSVVDPRVEVNRTFPANDRLNRRLVADHFQVPAAARKAGADALVTVGFVPFYKTLPTAMHVFSLQHLDPRNRVGLARELYRRWLTRFSWPKADLVITNSKFAVSQILSVYPQLRERIVQSYEGLQHELFTPAATATETADLKAKFSLDAGYFLWISNFYPYKQPELLIRGYAGLPDEIRKQHPLVMVGGDWENTLAASQRQVRQLGIEGNVIFLGWVDDRWLAPLYRQASAFCLASREETFGRCVIEAMACGTPAVVNDIPIMREVTEGHALIVDFTDTNAVTAALMRVATEHGVREELQRRGIGRAAHFTFERLVTERISAIQSLVERTGKKV